MTRHVGHRLVTAPSVEPITRDEVRLLLRNPPTAEDPYIDDLLPLARSMFEAASGVACITQTWRVTLDHWPGGYEEFEPGVQFGAISDLFTSKYQFNYITAPRYPLQSVSAITTYDLDRSPTSVTPADYFFADTASFPGRVVLKDSSSWPTALATRNAIEVDYVAGFGDAASDVPDTIKRAIQSVAVFLWQNRGEGCSATNAIAGSGALNIAAEYVTVRI
jgi:hypothetical protein